MKSDDIQIAVRGMIALVMIYGVFFALFYMDAEREFRLSCLNDGLEFTKVSGQMECKK